MKLLRLFKELFPPAPPKVDYKQRKKNNIRNIVARYASGSVRLKQGKYITEDDMAKKREEFRNYRFSN